MKHITITFFLIILLSMAGFGVSAHDIEVKNADGVLVPTARATRFYMKDGKWIKSNPTY